ncbi:MAG: efflux RND transporter permease subunit [Peptococcaceae bacterium]
MNITGFSIKRPAGITMIIMFFVVLGIYSYNRIGVDLLPAINTPIITVQVSYPGASAEEVEKQVIKHVEGAVSSTSNLKTMTSMCNQGSGFIVLQFDLSANVDQLAMDVSKKVDGIKRRLPDEARDILVVKRDINDQPVMYLGMSSPYSQVTTYHVANETIKDRLQKISGVAEVSVSGGRQEEIAVEIDKDKLIFYGVALNSIITKIGAESADSPVGKLNLEKDYDLRVTGEYQHIDDIAELAIPTASGSTIPLKNVAAVTRQIRQVQSSNRINGEDQVGIQIYKQSDASVVKTGEALRKEIEQLKKDYPDYNFYVSYDSSEYVNKSLNNTLESIFEGMITVSLALFFFLKEWRSMITVLIAIPASLVATLFAIYLAGFTFNIMSLMAMALCIGILVDDSIVVLENIHRHLHMGKSSETAAMEGRMEIGMAAIAITLCDVVVFLPIAFMSGMVGQFFRQFGLTVVFATLFSLFVSFTVTPMLSSRFYKSGVSKGQHFVWDKVDAAGAKVRDFYGSILRWALGHPKRILAGALLLFLMAVSLVPLQIVGIEYMPQADEGSFSINFELPVGTPYEQTDAGIRRIEDYVQTIPELDNYRSRVSANSGSVNVELKDKKERRRTVWEVTDETRAWCQKQFPPGTVRVNAASSSIAGMPGMGGGNGGASVQIQVLGPDNDKLVQISNEVMAILNQTPGAKDVNSNWRVGQPQIEAMINRDRVKYFGVALDDITRSLQTGISGTTAGTFVDQGLDIDINVRYQDGNKIPIEELRRLPVYSGGQTIALGNLVDFKQSEGPRSIRREDKQRAITVSCNNSDRPLQEFISDVDKRIKAAGFDPLYTIRFAGQAQSMQDTFGEMISALLLSITLVYMVLVILYESFLTPFIRMFSLPLGFIGALTALALTGNTLNLYSMIGFVMMDGLVAKNGTLLLDYTLTLIERGKTSREAVIEAGIARLRPIAMTSLTMIFGMLPTALAISEGAEQRVGMAWVLIGGLLTSTVFTLIVIPILFLAFNRIKEKLKLSRAKKSRTVYNIE